MSFNSLKYLALVIAFALFCCVTSGVVRAQSVEDEDEAGAQQSSSVEVAKKLASLDPLERQRAAEELARLAVKDQERLVAGYRLQEKNGRVRLALDWALYRMGRDASLFDIVRDLESSSRHEQAAGYLAQLDSPEPLYTFLQRANGNMQIRLLEVFAKLGDSETLERIKPFTSSFDPKIANAAKFATREINARLSQPAPDAAQRPRQVGNNTSNTSP
ncbi:MAG: hypothetical protein WCB68_12550 [Pyrinomonadaceae bacterium]